MKKYILILIFILIPITYCDAGSITFNGVTLNGISIAPVIPIMLFEGDSITKGIIQPSQLEEVFGYRDDLQTLMGITTSSNSYFIRGDYANPSIYSGNLYTAHNGISGQETSALGARINGELIAAFPGGISPPHSRVLIHMGTNDIIHNSIEPDVWGAITTGVQNISDTIDIISAFNPNINIYIAKIIPLGLPYRSTWVPQYNTELTNMVTAKQATKSNLFIVDMYARFTANPNWATQWMDSEIIHPNDTGYGEMADEWYDSIIANYSEEQ